MKTKFAGKTNPFTGAPARPVDHVDPASLSITSDPLPTGKATRDKYAALWAKIKPGQCIVCESHQVPQVASAMKKYVARARPDCTVRLTKNYGDGKGRVWLYRKSLKVAA